ncbi:hypothetical protein QAD02_023145 [Eretmocerus hayati]|uniref:Uncharacterized protein n=1 Tax=Eretmocerus hayati TaxID=131215 RepID=A0ACC2PV00_9HYME|nr:hypothetical protein QAD02_023145 [Eretmocerus hayati]
MSSPRGGDGEDRPDDVLDPRVQIELERLNTATDDINKLEVDLDEARATFRELLCESTLRIDTLAKKLGACIEKSRPYYDARFRAKEALTETQKAAMRFEKANSQHAAAKEMVYLAEEGLRTEGRSFDHAWQEMLNHATSRVNESEHERAICEAEHRRTFNLYHKAEHDVQRLQKELKRAITKSSMDARRSLLLINSIAYRHNLLMLPYYEMKAHFNHALEEQKLRVSALERSVTDAKMTYAEALRNLERISDEIHKTRRYDCASGCKKKLENPKSPTSEPSKTNSTGSSTTESPDSTDYTSDEYLRLPGKLIPDFVTNSSQEEESKAPTNPVSCTINMSSTEPRRYITRDRPRSIASSDSKHIVTASSQINTSPSELPDISNILSPIEKKVKIQSPDHDNTKNGLQNGDEWTDISLNNSPEDNCPNNNIESDEEDHIPYKPLSTDLSPEKVTKSGRSHEKFRRKRLTSQKSLPAMTEENEMSLTDEKKAQVVRSPSFKRKTKLDSCIATWMSRNAASGEMSSGSSGSPSRRQSLDMLWTSGTGERVKELLNQGMMMLNISNLTERRASESRVEIEKEKIRAEKLDKLEFIKDKKIPNALERTINYLNAEDETSDSESLASTEMLSEDQISSLMMEPDMNQVCQEVLGTPLVEVCPMLQQLQQQHS